MEIAKNTILITGANRGIGRAFAEVCAEEKSHLILANRTVDPELEKSLLEKGALSVKIFQVDFSNSQNIQNFLKQIENEAIDILFNNAGQSTGGLLEEQPLEQMQDMLQVNFNAVLHMSRALLPGMLNRKKGKIINHSSVMGVMNFPCAATYSATKAGVLSFSRSLTTELKGTGVSCLVLVTPGVETRMYNEIPKVYGKNFDMKLMGKGLPVKVYAQRIRDAILSDISELMPYGSEGLLLRIAQHTPALFQKLLGTQFHR